MYIFLHETLTFIMFNLVFNIFKPMLVSKRGNIFGKYIVGYLFLRSSYTGAMLLSCLLGSYVVEPFVVLYCQKEDYVETGIYYIALSQKIYYNCKIVLNRPGMCCTN